MSYEEEAFNIWQSIADKEVLWNTSIMDQVATDNWLKSKETNFETIPKNVQQYVPTLTEQFKKGGSGSSVTKHLDSGRLVVQRTHNSIRRKGGEVPLVRFFPKADAFHQKQVDRMNFWGTVFNAPAIVAPFLAPALAKNKGFTDVVLQHGNKKVPIRLGSQTGRNYWQQKRHRKLENQLQQVEKDLAGKDAFNVTNLKDSFNYPFSKGNLSSKEAALQTRISQFQAGGSKSTRDLNLTTSSAQTATGKLSKKEVAANAAAETNIAIPDSKGIIPRSVSPKLDFLSKQPQAEQVRKITTQIKTQHESEQLVPGDKKVSAQSLCTGEKVYNKPPEVKLAAGLQREAPWMLKKFGFLWDSAVEQAHHWFQKAFTGPFMQHVVSLARDPNSPITFYDVANMEAAAQSRGIPGIGDSGVGGIIESIHSWSHKIDRRLGREPTGGMPLSDAEMTPKQLKAEEARQKKFIKHYKETGEDIEELFPGPSLGILLKDAYKLKTADELTQYFMDIADEFYVPQMKRMQKLNEAARDDLTEFAHNVEKYRLMRDDIKAIIRGDAPNTLGYTKEQLKAKKDEYSFKYKEARDAQVKSAVEIDEHRDAVKEQKAELSLEQTIKDAYSYSDYDPILVEQARDIWEHVLKRSELRLYK